MTATTVKVNGGDNDELNEVSESLAQDETMEVSLLYFEQDDFVDLKEEMKAWATRHLLACFPEAAQVAETPSEYGTPNSTEPVPMTVHPIFSSRLKAVPTRLTPTGAITCFSCSWNFKKNSSAETTTSTSSSNIFFRTRAAPFSASWYQSVGIFWLTVSLRTTYRLLPLAGCERILFVDFE